MKILFFSFKLNLDLDICAVIFGKEIFSSFVKLLLQNKKIPEKKNFVKKLVHSNQGYWRQH